MDAEVLAALTDCKAIKDRDGTVKPCPFWREHVGRCVRPNNVDCPEGVRGSRQEVADSNYSSLD